MHSMWFPKKKMAWTSVHYHCPIPQLKNWAIWWNNQIEWVWLPLTGEWEHSGVMPEVNFVFRDDIISVDHNNNNNNNTGYLLHDVISPMSMYPVTIWLQSTETLSAWMLISRAKVIKKFGCQSTLARPFWRVPVWRDPVGRVPLRRDARLARDSLTHIPVWRVAVQRVSPVVHFSRFLYILTHSALHKEMNNVEMRRSYVTLRKN